MHSVHRRHQKQAIVEFPPRLLPSGVRCIALLKLSSQPLLIH
jgi:hypothetical protein